MNQIQQSFLSNLQIQDRYLSTSKLSGANKTSNTENVSFQDILAQKAQETAADAPLKFSKHASNRLADRNIELTRSQMDRLAEGTQKAGAKGIRDSLVMVDNLAFIVNVPNGTVITALDQTQADEKIFTNIDGAVIA
ncbi:MAG: flagellar protein [Lachnospiraceae bacterium]|nr:flagellar protein [Lachnospiraceae bacterium]